jgi:hypothetical protein
VFTGSRGSIIQHIQPALRELHVPHNPRYSEALASKLLQDLSSPQSSPSVFDLMSIGGCHDRRLLHLQPVLVGLDFAGSSSKLVSKPRIEASAPHEHRLFI